MQVLQRVTFLNGGYCTQWSYLAGRRSWKVTRFHAVFVYLEHPEHGAALIDTGYSPYFFEATHSFPQRLYRWLTPVHLDPHEHAAAILMAHALQPASIRTVFVSHFHGDHVTGLRHFPEVRFVYRRESLEALSRETSWRQVRHAFLPGLLPADLRERGDAIADRDFTSAPGLLAAFRVHDFWGDGSLLLVDLPGHALGHTGFVLQTASERIFYIVDACWDLDVLLEARQLPLLARGVQHDYPAYLQTQAKLRPLRSAYRLVACHCPRTQAYVAKPQG